MIFDAPGKPTNLKKAVYLIASVILGLLLSLIFHALIEINFLHWMLSHSRDVNFYGGCALHPVLQAALWIIGAIGGLMLGKYWWRKIYIERIWENKMIKNRK